MKFRIYIQNKIQRLQGIIEVKKGAALTASPGEYSTKFCTALRP